MRCYIRQSIEARVLFMSISYNQHKKRTWWGSNSLSVLLSSATIVLLPAVEHGRSFTAQGRRHSSEMHSQPLLFSEICVEGSRLTTACAAK